MRLFRQLVLIAMVPIVASGLAVAQMSSAEYNLPAGAPVGGGGNSTDGNTYEVDGVVVLGAAGTSGGGSFIVAGGPIHATLAGIAVVYSGTAADTVPVAPRQLKVAYLGGTGPATGVLFYRLGGQLAYASLNMVPGVGDTLIANLPANLLTPRGLEYYFQVTRGTSVGYAGSPAGPYVFVPEFLPGTAARPPATLPDQSYRMVSVAVDVTGPITVAAVFADDLGAYDPKQWRLFRYDPATGSNVEFPNAAAVKPERAYWLIVRGANKSYSSLGITRRPNRSEGGGLYYEVPLDSGWNQLANPWPFDADWTEVLFDTTGGVTGPDTSFMEDSAYWYNGAGYVTTTTIPAWHGVFVKTKRPGVSALFRYHEAGALPTRPQQPDSRPQVSAANWDVEVRLAANGHFDAGNFLGVRADAAVGSDGYDYSEPPVAPEGAQLAFRLPDDSPGLRRSDFRPAFTDGATWDLVMPRELNRTLTVHGLDRIPAGMNATLLLDAGIVVKLTEGTEVTIPNDIQSARLVIGTEAYAAGSESGLLPTEFALHQNFPNPFNPDTRIRFALPVEAKLRIDVFNVLGQKVRTLTDDTYPAGTHDIVWNGRSDNGEPVGSGVYFYRLTSPQFTETRRMILIK